MTTSMTFSLIHNLFKTSSNGEETSVQAPISKLLINLLESATDGVLITGLDGRVVAINRAFEELHGWKREHVAGKLLPWIPTHLIDEVNQLSNSALSGQSVDGHPSISLRQDGSYIPISLTIFPIANSENTHTGLVYVETRLITIEEQPRDKACSVESVRMKNMLMETENTYKNLVENAQIGVYLYQEGRVIYVNPHLAQIFGYTVEEFVFQNNSNLIAKEDWIKLQNEATSALKSHDSKHTFELRGTRKDQRIIYIEGTVTYIIYNGKPAVFVTCQEVTYKKEMEQLMLESAQRYRKLVELLPEPIIVNSNGTIIYGNISAVQLVGAKCESEIIGTSIFDFLHPDDHENSRKTIQRIMESDEPPGLQRRKLVKKSGDIVEVEINSIRLHDFHGKSVVLSVLRDLTEQIIEEEALIQSEKLAAVGKLAAGVAHEIRNPLTALRGFCQLLRKKYSEDYYYFGIMIDELDRINMIVNDFMTLSKPQISKFEKANINKILQSVISILETQALLNNVSIVATYNEVPPICCEEGQLKQVFVNVINNAIHAMPSGGEIKVSTTAKHDRHIQVTIQDEGIGIPEDIIRKVGEPFFTTKENGTGLGLMISRRIIENHNGLFVISSKENLGTTVDISLPIPLINY